VKEFLDKKGDGIQHIGFFVDDIAAETAKMAEKGFKITQSAETPTVIWAYFGTDATGGFAIELMQKK
ncbi:MAG: VOC family protein, partial [Dehalococcoidales bacterium]